MISLYGSRAHRYFDQSKLVSLDHLFHRSLEFHNNIHNFKATCLELPSLEGMHVDETQHCGLQWRYLSLSPSADNNGRSGDREDVSPETTGAVKLAEVSAFLPMLDRLVTGKEGILWIHLKDVRALGPIARHLNIHELCWSEFFDLRAHSNAVATPYALAATICTLQMQKENSHLYKVHAYVSDGLFISYERELVPDLDNIDTTAALPTDMIYRALEDRVADMLDNIKNLGSVYMLYELVMECLNLSNPVLEFMSRSVFFLRQQVHKDLTYQERRTNHRQIHILLSAAHLLDRHVAEWTNEVASFLLQSSTVHQLLNQGLATPAHHPYFHDMGDSYEYRSLCLKNIHDDLRTLLATMDSVINVRSQQTNVNLSLVATIFLPITFLAGVFGMNFVEGGDYTMMVLNKKWGPDVFYAVCSGVVLLNVLIFLHSGYISWWTLLKFVGIRESPLTEDEQRTEAEKEDVRRAKEADFLRNLSKRQYNAGTSRASSSGSFVSGSSFYTESGSVNGAGLWTDGRSAKRRYDANNRNSGQTNNSVETYASSVY